MTASILVVDDLPALREMLSQSLASEGYRVATAGSGEEAVTRLEEQEFDVIVTDLVMPGLGGLDVLERARLLDPRAAVILMTAYASLDTAIAALRRGACDYLEKPFTVGDLKLRVRRLLQYREMVWRERLLQRALHPRPSGDTLIGESGAIRAVRDQIARSAGTSSNVLITGESGVGKELVARAVHAASARRDRAFIALNCGAIPDTLLESQLFGHLRGAFTTAVQANPGLFVVANHGTLFLDEIGELPLPLQVKLLRVIEEKHVWPVGGTRPVPVDVRLIASTNRDLASEVAGGRFRTDLFYRLNVLHLKLPPLRERRGDIPLLVDHLVDRLNAKLGTRFLGVEREALRALIGQPWKGNVRELENVLERAMVLGGGDLITLRDVSADLTAPAGPLPRDLREAVRRFERQHVMEVVAEARSDKREAAQVLGISLASLYRKLSLDIDDEPAPAPGG
jgi:two-component system response regulator PilR (NtrC family)